MCQRCENAPVGFPSGQLAVWCVRYQRYAYIFYGVGAYEREREFNLKRGK